MKIGLSILSMLLFGSFARISPNKLKRDHSGVPYFSYNQIDLSSYQTELWLDDVPAHVVMYDISIPITKKIAAFEQRVWIVKQFDDQLERIGPYTIGDTPRFQINSVGSKHVTRLYFKFEAKAATETSWTLSQVRPAGRRQTIKFMNNRPEKDGSFLIMTNDHGNDSDFDDMIVSVQYRDYNYVKPDIPRLRN